MSDVANVPDRREIGSNASDTERQPLTAEQLEANWLGWANANLGLDAAGGSAAAAAAVHAIGAGKDTRAAAAAAISAWLRSGAPRDRVWRMSFWGLLLNDRQVWILIPLVLSAQVLWLVRPLGFIAAICLTVPAGAALIAAVQGARYLAAAGVVAPGSLIRTREIRGARGSTYESTYQFDAGGPCLVVRTAADTPHDVLVFFDPQHPGRAVVIDRQFEF